MTATFPIGPRPLMALARRCLCMNLALPPMNVSSTSTSPRIFSKVPVCMESRIR